MTPTIGRIVLYALNEGDVAALKGVLLKQQQADPSHYCNSLFTGTVWPAVVVAVFGPTTVNLKVLIDGSIPDYWATSRLEGTTPGTWAWPARV